MKIIILMIACLMLLNCAESKYIDGKMYKPYGLFNEEQFKDSSLIYIIPSEVKINMVISSLYTFGIVGIYIIGFELYEPVCKKIKVNK